VRCEILITHATAPKGRGLLEAMLRGAGRAGVDACITRKAPRPDALLMLYGLGGRDRFELGMKAAAEGRLVSWDAGYWDRHYSPANRKYRVSLNGMHPTPYVMRGPDPGAERWRQSGLSISPEVPRKDGPILLVGNGPKSNAIGAAGWTAAKARELRRRFPHCRIAYRPKPTGPNETGVDCDEIATGPIEDEVRRASLVVCRHSNVAVDACRLGVAAVCEDGAAAAVYPRTLDEYEMQPSYEQRVRFLHRLAWWQWSPVECETGAAWRWLRTVLGA
jgi:hypothetical protein